MKSYKSHLLSTKSFGEIQSKNYRPVMRSSAAFPLIHKPGKLFSIYTFMGYWLRKRNINLVTVLVTVRNVDGKKILQKSLEVDNVKSYILSSFDVLEDNKFEFIGSIELEIFSAVDMVFPYPAITFGIKGTNGLTFVHTCGRIYNDFDDMKSNTEQTVPETGFDVYNGNSYTPFFAFVNGPIAIENEEIELEYFDIHGSKVVKKKKIENVKPYGLGWIELLDKNEKNEISDTFRTCVKIRHNFEGFFPRFVAGNILRNYEDISLTHSFYDTSVDKSNEAIWKNPSKEKYYDSVIAIPFDSHFNETELVVYPNFVYSPTSLHFEVYSSEGEFLELSKKSIEVANGNDKLLHIGFHEMFPSLKDTIKNGMVKIICSSEGNIPARLKFGLNFIRQNNGTNLPSNICFNAHVANDKLLKKPGGFMWCPLFDPYKQKIFLHNTSFTKEKFRDAKIVIEVYRESDDKKIESTINLSYNGTTEVLCPMNLKIDQFLNGESGWISFASDTPFVKGFYITDFDKGVIGADHLY